MTMDEMTEQARKKLSDLFFLHRKDWPKEELDVIRDASRWIDILADITSLLGDAVKKLSKGE